MLHDFVELLTLLTSLESIHTADRQQALQSRIHMACIARPQQLES